MKKSVLNLDPKVILEYESNLHEATKNNDAYSMYNIGVMYYTGELGKVDYAMAAEWYEKAADLGLKEAQYNLAFMYDTGKGVKNDFEKAMRLYKLAAEQGDDLAQHNIGVLYTKGEGVPVNLSEAKKWYTKSCYNGNELSCQILKDLTSEEEHRKILEINHLKSIGDKGMFDGKSIKQIKQYLKAQGIEESFSVWQEIKNGYLGVALVAIDYELYDFAENIEELEDIKSGLIDGEFSDFISIAINQVKDGKGKPKCEFKKSNSAFEDNVLDTLSLIDFELGLLENGLNCSENNNESINSGLTVAMVLQGMLVRFGESLRVDGNKFALEVYEKINTTMDKGYSLVEISLLKKDIRSIRNTISKAEDYHKKYIRNEFLGVNKEIEFNKKKISNIKMEIYRIKKTILGIDNKINSLSHNKSKDVDRLRKSILNLEAKYCKIKKARDEGKREDEKSELELEKISRKVEILKNDMNIAKIRHVADTNDKVKKAEAEKEKWLECKENCEKELKNLEAKIDPFR